MLRISGIFSTAKLSGWKGRDAVCVLWVAEESIFPFCQVHTVGEPPAWTVMLRAVLVMSTLVTGPLSEAATSSSMIVRVWMPSRGDIDGVTFEEGARAVRLGSSEGVVGDDE